MRYALKLNGGDSKPLAATYYPSKKGTAAAVVLLVHEKGRSAKDFDDPIADLKRKGLAEQLQEEDYAVLSFDLRGHGLNPRRELSPREWKTLVNDVQVAYKFLLDRHNRGELNLAKLAAVGVGEGANLIAAWAALPGAAVSGEGRIGDLGALVLISPQGDATSQGLRIAPSLATLAQRIPMLVMAGERDAASMEAVTANRAVVERSRLNKVEAYPTSLHGYKLLWLQPKAASSIGKFLETTVKFRAEEYEPRYNLTPVEYKDVQLVRRAAPVDPAAAPPPAAKKAEEPAQAKPAVK